MERLEIIIGSKKSPIKLKLNEFKGRKLLDIRKYYSSNEELMPTKKGISLNASQYAQIIDSIKKHHRRISDHFDLHQRELDIEIEYKATLGRSFTIHNENSNQIVILNPKFKDQLHSMTIDDFTSVLVTIYKSITDVIEDDEDISRILDRLDHHLKRAKW